MWSVLSWTSWWMCWYSYIHYLLYSLKMLSRCSAGLHTMQGPVPRVSHCQDWEWPSAWPTENTHPSLAVYKVCLLQMPLDLLCFWEFFLIEEYEYLLSHLLSFRWLSKQKLLRKGSGAFLHIFLFSSEGGYSSTPVTVPQVVCPADSALNCIWEWPKTSIQRTVLQMCNHKPAWDA